MWSEFFVSDEHRSKVVYDVIFIETNEETKDSDDWAFSMIFKHTHQFYFKSTCQPLIENVKEYQCESGARHRLVTIEEMKQSPATSILDKPLGAT